MPKPRVRDVGAALGLPEVVPELAAVARVDRPGVVRRGDVERAVHRQHRRLDRDRGADREVAGAFAADDESAAADRRRRGRRRSRRRRGSPTRRSVATPGQRQVLDGLRVDLRQRAVALAGVVAVVSRPRVRQRLQELGRVEALALARSAQRGGDEQRCGRRAIVSNVISVPPGKPLRRACPCR